MVNRQTKTTFAMITGVAWLAGCASTPAPDTANAEPLLSPDQERAALARQDPLTQATYWSSTYEADPTNLDVATEFVTALRAIGSHERALEVASDTLSVHPDDTRMKLLAGRSLTSLKRFVEAETLLGEVITAEPANVDAIAALALVLDRTGRHRAAQAAYRQALMLSPDRPTTVSNLAMSVLLSGNPVEAERLLREAVQMPGASPMVRQNLALVVGLQGRFDEMRAIGGEDLPDEMMDANVDTLRAMLTPQRSWDALRDGG